MKIFVCPCGSDVLNVLDRCQVCEAYLCFNCIIKDDTRCINCSKFKTQKRRNISSELICKSCQKEFAYKNRNLCFKCGDILCPNCKLCQNHKETCEVCFRDSKPIPFEIIKNLNDTKFVKPVSAKFGTFRCAVCKKRWCNDCGFQNVIYVNNLAICREHYVECVNIPCGKQYVPCFKCNFCDNYLCPHCSHNDKCYQC